MTKRKKDYLLWKSGSILEQIVIKRKNAIKKNEKWVMPSDKSYDTDKKLPN